ncbi:MAG: DUF5110 domain-containing protein [Mollicutes bacterium]|nr:DUF5110 domain-containing protein [Mollicutes bacterium]
MVEETMPGLANSKAIIKGKTYRITILTDRLIRFEYNKNGVFEDRPSLFAKNRNLNVPAFNIREDKTFVEITTKYCKIEYLKEKTFLGNRFVPGGNLHATLINTENSRVWYYNHPEVRNFKSTNICLENFQPNYNKNKGLYSTDGFVSIDDSKSLVIENDGELKERSEETIDLYLFVYNNDFGLALKDYFILTGKPPMLPRYALGNWWSKNYAYKEKDLYKLFANFSRHNIPISVLLLDKDWHIREIEKRKDLITGYTFNNKNFEKPLDFIKRIHAFGVRLGLNINPIEGFYPHEEHYQKAAEYLGDSSKKVIPFNVFDRRNKELYFKLFLKSLDNMGIDFFWNDYYQKKDIKSLEALNHYHFLEADKNEVKRGFLMSRNSMMGDHRYGVLYSGNSQVSWNTLKAIPEFNSMSANMGLSWWSHDIGGFKGGIEDKELYLRYVQLGTFSPIFRIHVNQGKYYKREPWRWDVQTFEIIREYMQLRHKLIPYIYTEAYNYHNNGVPLIQPIYYSNPSLYDEPLFRSEYYFGSELLVAPLTMKKDLVMDRVIHKFYLPQGMWYDFKTGKRFPGNRSYVSFFKDQDFPVFAKAGSIIPLADEITNNANLPQNMEIHVFPGKTNSYRLYEDDGITNLYKKGFYLTTLIDYNYQANNYTVIIRSIAGKSGIVPPQRNYKIRFRNTRPTEEVVAYFNDSQIEINTFEEDNDFIVELKNISTVGQLSINCKGKAIEIDALRLINEEIDSIISDLAIETNLKEKIAEILFGELTIRKKRIEIRKLKNKGLEKNFVKMFIRLLEYIAQI